MAFAALRTIVGAHPLGGLFLFLVIEEAGVPLLVPGDTLIMAAGARSGGRWSTALLVIGVAALAATCGSSLLYAAVRRGGRPLLHRFGRFLHLNERRIDVIDAWFQRYGPLAIVVGRLIPGLRTPTTVMAGLFGVPYRVFLPATAAAALLWAAGYFAAGLLLWREWPLLRRMLLRMVNPIGLGLIIGVALIAGVAAWRWRGRQERKSESRKVEAERSGEKISDGGSVA